INTNLAKSNHLCLRHLIGKFSDVEHSGGRGLIQALFLTVTTPIQQQITAAITQGTGSCRPGRTCQSLLG
ncbi:hypothetical protein GOODEAATRI_016685, partial [Goodea atripinnis]